ncbi:MAG: CRTAC1 family protein [Planctomycetaceae bacterium]
MIAADLNEDGWCDLYVANDGDPNFLWLNQAGTGRFTEDGLLAGVALQHARAAQAGMGVDAGDLDGDGDEDIVVAHLTGEANAIYVNLSQAVRGPGDRVQMQASSFPYTAFGARFFDGDLDGDLDLALVNGAVRQQLTLLATNDPEPLRQENQLFHNDGPAGFTETSAGAGDAWRYSAVGRGLATGDLDNDGDMDLVITNNGGMPRVLLSTGERANWVGLQLRDSGASPTQSNVVARFTLPDGSVLTRRSHTDGSYLSSSDPRIIAGLGEQAGVVHVTLQWPDGLSESWSGLRPNRYHELQAGTGQRTSHE